MSVYSLQAFSVIPVYKSPVQPYWLNKGESSSLSVQCLRYCVRELGPRLTSPFEPLHWFISSPDWLDCLHSFVSCKFHQWLLRGYVRSPLMAGDPRGRWWASQWLNRNWTKVNRYETKLIKLLMRTTFQSLNHVTQLNIIDWGSQMDWMSNGLKSAAVKCRSWLLPKKDRTKSTFFQCENPSEFLFDVLLSSDESTATAASTLVQLKSIMQSSRRLFFLRLLLSSSKG